MIIGEENERPLPASQTGNDSSGPQAPGDGRIGCHNCGADFLAEEPRCPYCGALNPAGAEKAYMDTLEDIEDKTGDLIDDTQGSLRTSLRNNAARTIAIIVFVAAAIGTLFLVSNCMDQNYEHRAVQEYQAREAFRTTYFEEFDRLYEAGDDDALSTYVWSLMDDPGFDALITWKHARYLEAHDSWQTLRSIEDDIEAGTVGIDDYVWSVSLALRLAQLGSEKDDDSAALTPEEESRAAGYREYAREFLRNALHMNDEEVAAFADQAKDAEGYIQADTLKQNLELRLQQLGVPY